MPSTATITTYYNFTSGTIYTAEVNHNFSVFRGHLCPVDASLAALANLTYDLGSIDHAWRNVYSRGLMVIAATTTGDTPATTTAYNIFIKSTDGKAYKKDSLGNESGLGGGSWATSSQTLASNGNISLTANELFQSIVITGNTTTGSTLSTTPFGNSAPTDGTFVRVIGGSNNVPAYIVSSDTTYGAIGNFSSIEFVYGVNKGFQYSATLQRWVYSE